MEGRQVIPKRNSVKADVMVAPLFYCSDYSGQSLGLSLPLCMPDLSPAATRFL
jgi:hypothetical protein